MMTAPLYLRASAPVVVVISVADAPLAAILCALGIDSPPTDAQIPFVRFVDAAKYSREAATDNLHEHQVDLHEQIQTNPLYFSQRLLTAVALPAVAPTEADTFSHPSAVLVAVPAAHSSHLTAIQSALASFQSAPFFDPSAPVLVAFVDDADSPCEQALSNQAEISKSFPTTLVSISATKHADASTQNSHSLYQPFISTATNSLSDPLSSVSESDLDACRALIYDFVVKHIMNYFVNNIRNWDRQFAAQRRGISSRLFKVGLKYFAPSKQTAHPLPFDDPSTGATIFPFAAPEFILRRLADHAFSLRDFKYAISIYESVKKDFSSSPKYIKFYAAINEILAVASLALADPSTFTPSSIASSISSSSLPPSSSNMSSSTLAASSQTQQSPSTPPSSTTPTPASASAPHLASHPSSSVYQPTYGSATLPLGSVGSNVETFLQTAVQAYKDAKAPLYAARAVFLVSEAAIDRGLYRDAADILIRMASDESDLRAALFLERAASCFLACSPPMPRKHAFHLVLAAHRYVKAGLRNHAIRCYQTSLSSYIDRGWTLIQDHIHFALGRQCFHSGNLEQAATYFVQLLRKSRQTSALQRSYLSEFLYIYQQIAAIAESKAEADGSSIDRAALPIPQVPLPVVVDSNIIVSSSNTTSTNSNHPLTSSSGTSNNDANNINQQDDTSVWQRLEHELVDHININQSTEPKQKSMLSAPVSLQPVNTTPGITIAAVGEPVTVSFYWQNPMQVPIPTNNVYLDCVYYPSNMNIPDIPNMESKTDTISTPTRTTSNRIERDEFDVDILSDVSLDSNERRLVQLHIYPKREGQICVRGVRYLVCGLIPTWYGFRYRGKRLNETSSQRQDGMGVYASDVTYKIMVTPPMPVLETVIHGLKENVMMGEVMKMLVELRNTGTRGLCQVYVCRSDPNMVWFGDHAMLESNVYENRDASNHKNTADEVYNVSNKIGNDSVVLLRLPSMDGQDDGILSASSSTLVPMWISFDRPGRHVIRLLFAYESEDRQSKSTTSISPSTSTTSYRTHRVVMTVNVVPSIRVNTFIRTSVRDVHEFVLGVELENVSDGLIGIKQLTSMSPSWKIDTVNQSNNQMRGNVDEVNDGMMMVLGPGQTRYVYLRVCRYMSIVPGYVPSVHGSNTEPGNSGNVPVHMSPEIMTTHGIEKLILSDTTNTQLSSPQMRIGVRNLVSLTSTNKGESKRMISTQHVPIRDIVYSQRRSKRISALVSSGSPYSVLTEDQIRRLFTIFWTDDLDLVVFWGVLNPSGLIMNATQDTVSTSTNIPSLAEGHVLITGMNMSMSSPLPLSSWLGRIDPKSLAGRALFSATVRERIALYKGLVKSNGSSGMNGTMTSESAMVSSSTTTYSVVNAKRVHDQNTPVRVIVQAPCDIRVRDVPINESVGHENDFGVYRDGDVVVVPVDVCIGNMSWLYEVEYVFEAGGIAQPSSQPQIQQQQDKSGPRLSSIVPKSNTKTVVEDSQASVVAMSTVTTMTVSSASVVSNALFSWIGSTRFSGTLLPGSTTRVRLYAGIRVSSLPFVDIDEDGNTKMHEMVFGSGGGVYDVNRWKLHVVLKVCREAMQLTVPNTISGMDLGRSASMPGSRLSPQNVVATASGSSVVSNMMNGEPLPISFVQVPTMPYHIYVSL